MFKVRNKKFLIFFALKLFAKPNKHAIILFIKGDITKREMKKWFLIRSKRCFNEWEIAV